MFESISIMPNRIRNSPIDIGELAERMLYYKQVHVFVGKEELKTLFEFADVDLLVEFMKRGTLKIHNKRKHYGVMHRTDIGPNVYMSDFVYKQDYDLKDFIYEAYFQFSNDKEKSKKAASKLYKYIGIYDAPNEFAKQIDIDLHDSELMKTIIAENIKYYLPHEPFQKDDIIFEIERTYDQLVIINSNIDTKRFPFLDPASILLNVGTAFDKIKIIGNYNTEISCPELDSRIIATKFNSIIQKSTRSDTELNYFKHAVYNNGPSIKEVINSKERTLEEFLALLDVAERFKNWLTDLDENGNLINEYLKSLGEKTWIQSTKSKAIRFYLVQGASTILKATGSLKAIVTGLALSAFNTFLVDKLIKDWKPNQFIENEIKTFVNGDAVQE